MEWTAEVCRIAGKVLNPKETVGDKAKKADRLFIYGAKF